MNEEVGVDVVVEEETTDIEVKSDVLKGEPGVNGKDGKDGKDGVNGKDGENGANGKSVYEIAVEKGFEGTEEEWLASLKGKDGASGKDGINGTNGVDGKDGKSAYQIWLDKGNTGTEVEFLASLKGKDGTMTFEDLTEEQKETLKGEKGETGSSGVYLGTEEPADSSVNIWINPDGTTEEFATKEYIDTAISTAITNVLGGSY